MKRLGIHSASCSCTSCVYRSRSKQADIQQVIEEGSRIDKLYYGKYLPLRERKLLEKLIRTRAVYDDVRSQLLSTSGSSEQTRSIHKVKRRDDDSTEKSSAVLKLVDLVDRGEIGSSNTSKLSSCCTCCSCSSLRKIKKHMEKHPPKIHRHHVPYEEIARYSVEAEKRGRRQRRRLSTKISGKVRAVKFKMKQIRSEPCTCTLSLSSMHIRQSKTLLKKGRSKEREIAEVQPQHVVTTERKPLRKKICSCSCKIAKLPMKSIQKIKNIRKSNTKSSGTEMGHQRAFRIKKDSLTIFREKILKKRAYKDWECEPGICVVDECIPEECLERIKASKGVGETRTRKYHHRHSGTGRERNRISTSTRSKNVKVTDSKVQASPTSNLSPVICECKPTSKSASSMTSFPKSKSLVKIQSMTTDLKVKQSKSPKRKAQVMLRETEQQEMGLHALNGTESFERKESAKKERVQNLPKSKLGHVICECKPITKSTASLTIIHRKQDWPPVSKTEVKVKRPVTPKARPQIVIKEERAYKTTHRDKELVQVVPKSNLGHVICECKATKSVASMTTILKTQDLPSVDTETEIKVKRPKSSKEKAHIILKQEKSYKTRHHERELERSSPKSNLGDVICDCKPLTKSVASMTTILKNKELPSTSKTDIKVKRPKSSKERAQLKQERAHKTRHREKELRQPATKSVASMTTILKKQNLTSVSKMEIKVKRPKSPKERPQIVVIQEKAHKTGRREKELVQPVPKSRMGNVICECKPSTKSVSSMTSVPTFKIKRKSRKIRRKEKQVKVNKHRKEEEYIHHEQQEADIQAVKISSSFKFEIEFSKKKYPELNSKELIEHVNTKRAKNKRTHVKNKHHRKYQHSKIQANRETKSSQETASQASKSFRKTVLPFPRECDPESCARILQSRSKSRGRSSTSNTHRLRRKSIGSTTSSQKTSSKSRYIQSESTESLITKPSELSKPKIIKYDSVADNSHPQKQAVKIASNFSFSIEFYKDKSPGLKPDETQDYSNNLEYKISQQVPRKKNKEMSQATRNIKTRNISSQSRSTQSFKNVQFGHRLKRCFCTLKLLQKKKQRVMQSVSKKTMASLQMKDLEKRSRIRETQTKPESGIAYVIPPMTSHPAALLPYECEPLFCTPGECNPYVCAERIKERNRKKVEHFSKLTNTTSTPKRSKMILTSHNISTSSRKIQSIEIKNRNPKVHRSNIPRLQSKVLSDNREKQAVRIGSSFSFNIEFSKEKHDQNAYKVKEFVLDEPVKKERKQQHKGIKVHKPRVRPRASSTARNVKTKQTYTTPFLERCFCTLKLFKNNKRMADTIAPRRNITCQCKDYIVQMQNKSITTKSANMSYHNEKLLPFKCEPGVCGNFDPYTFDRLGKIKIQPTYSNTDDISNRSIFSEISRSINLSKSQNIQLFTKESKEKAIRIMDTDRHRNELNIIPSQGKSGAVRVDSSFNFNIELDKKKPSANNNEYVKTHDNIQKRQIPDNSINRHNYENSKLKAIGSSQLNHHLYHKLISNEQKPKQKGIYVGAAITRCFCTLKGKKSNLQEKNKAFNKITTNPQICGCKSKSAKICRHIYDLKSYEYRPDSFISGIYNPIQCQEEIKRLEIKQLYDRQNGNDRRKRKSCSSMTTSTLNGSIIKSTHSRFLRQTPIKNQKVIMVLEDVMPKASISASHQTIRVGSKVSFNVDFSKDTAMPYNQDTLFQIDIEKGNRISDTVTVKKNKENGTKDNNRLSHANKIQKEDKVSNIGLLLKRCLCTLGLQKRKDTQKTKKPKYEFLKTQPITAQFVQAVQLDQDKRNACNIVSSHIKRQPELKKVYSKPDENLCQKESLKFKLSGDTNHLKHNIFNMSEKKNYYFANHSSIQSNSLIKNAHLRSHIDFNIDGYRVEHSKLQKTNPYFQSFYALNLKVSHLKNKNCIGNNKKNKLKSKSQIAKAHTNSSVDYRSNYMMPQSGNPNQPKGLHMDTNFSIGMGFFKDVDPLNLNQAQHVSRKSLNNNVKHNDSQTYAESKTTAMIKRCLCSLKLRKGNGVSMDNKTKNNQPTPDAHYNKNKHKSIENIYLSNPNDKNAKLKRNKDLCGTKTSLSQPEKDIRNSHPRQKDSRRGRNKTKGKSSQFVECLCPVQTKTDSNIYVQPSSRNALRLGTDLSFAVEFYKNTYPDRGDIKITSNQQEKQIESYGIRNKTKDKSSRLAKCLCPIRTTLRHPLRDAGTQMYNESQNKQKCVSKVFTRCFCVKVKNKNKSFDKGKRGLKLEKNKNKKQNTKVKKDEAAVVKKSYGKHEIPPDKRASKKCDPHKCNKLKQKRMKNLQEHAVGTDHPKHKSTSTVAKKIKKNKTKSIKSKPRDWSTSSIDQNKEHETLKKSSEKRGVSFDSSFNLNLEFFKDQTRLLSSLSPVSTRSPEQYQVYYSSVEESGDRRRRKTLEQNGLNQADPRKNKKPENMKNKLNADVCEPHTCVPGKCDPVECKKRIKQRLLGSKRTKTKEQKKTADRSTATKGKRVQVQDKLKEIDSDNQSPNLNSCNCANPPTEPGKNKKKKKNLKTFIKNCICGLARSKEGKRLTTKLSTERIVDVKRKGIAQNKKAKPTLKFDMKEQNSEMKTIMPYSKKKFKKLDSQTKIAQNSNKLDAHPCPCVENQQQKSKPQRVKKGTEPDKHDLEPRNVKISKVNKKYKEQVQNEDDTLICPQCRDTAKNKKSLHTCDCPEDTDAKSKKKKDSKILHSPWCPEKIGDQAISCPVCLANTKIYKNRAKQRALHTCLCFASIGDQVCRCTAQTSDKSDNKQNKKRGKKQDLLHPVEPPQSIKLEKRPKGVKKNKEPISQIDDSCDVCPCCAAKLESGVKKNKLDFIDIIKNMCSTISLKKNEKKEVDKKPLFEMVVNKNNMNIMNREEVLRKLGSTGKDTKVMKKARKAYIKGEAEPPVMDMLINVNNANIINSDDVLHTVKTGKSKAARNQMRVQRPHSTVDVSKKTKKSLKCKSLGAAEKLPKGIVKKSKSERKAHDKNCDCCICRGRRRKLKTGDAKTGAKLRKLKPCVCGSVVCKKDWEKLKKEQTSVKGLKIKPCVCGSTICQEESQKMPDILLEAARQAQLAKEKAIQDVKDEKLYQKQRLLRKKQYTKEDRKRWKRRKKQAKRDLKQVKKYDRVPDCLLVAESLVDIGKFGATAFCDLMRTLFRVAKHPRDGVHNIKDAARKPVVAAKEIKESCEGMGLYTTADRVKRRILKMNATKAAVTTLESYPVTNYALHMMDKSPKHRMKKFKNRRLREPLDFECSLFMASLRKRPCLRVYYMCPWFYPHCVSLLGIWKQFTDVLLFILAVGVWSPCILAMELCRAMMCCCLCTG